MVRISSAHETRFDRASPTPRLVEIEAQSRLDKVPLEAEVSNDPGLEIAQSNGQPNVDFLKQGMQNWADSLRRNLEEKLQAPRQEVLPSIGPTTTPQQLISNVLKSNPGVFIGDTHGEHAIPEFLANSAGDLKAAGVRRMYVEMFQSKDQPMLDRFWNKGDNRAELVQHLKDDGWDKSPGWPEKVVSMLEATKKEGIRPYGIDIENTGLTRLETSNPHWTRVIQAREAQSSDGSRYVVWGGLGHSAQYPLNKGVDFRLGIPSVDFRGSASLSAPVVKRGDGKGSDYDVILPSRTP